MVGKEATIVEVLGGDVCVMVLGRRGLMRLETGRRKKRGKKEEDDNESR